MNTTELTDPAVAAKQPVTTTIRCMSLKQPPAPREYEPNKFTDFQLCIVDSNAAMKYVPATEAAYRQCVQQKLNVKHNVDFILTLKDGVVSHIAIQERPDNLPFSKSTGEDSEYPGSIKFSIGPDNEALPIFIPTRMAPDKVAEISAELTKLASANMQDIRPGSRLLGKYTILEFRGRVGGNEIYVDPMER